MSREDVTIMAHRRADWGSVTKVSPGVWRIRYWADGPDGYRRRSKTVRGSRKDAGDALAKLRLDHSADAPCPTVGQCWDLWMLPDLSARVESGDLRQDTFDKYRYNWDAAVDPRWGRVPMDSVRAMDVQAWLSETPYNAATLAMRTLRALFDYGVRFEVVERNVMRERYRMPSRSTVARRDGTAHDLHALLGDWDAVRGSFIEASFLLCAFGSCRPGESMAATGADVSAAEVAGVPFALVTVDKQVSATGRPKPYTKTDGSARTVAVPGLPGLRLLEIAAERGPMPLAGDGSGLPVTLSRRDREWTARLADAGIEPILYKNLRRSWRTFMRHELGVPADTLETLMGHAGKGVSGKHYDAPSVEALCAEVAAAYEKRPEPSRW
ncbi:hypothetical protein AAK967_02410 [Atopobiaceae bacterium 24-176]